MTLSPLRVTGAGSTSNGVHDAILYLLCVREFSFCCAESKYRRRDYSDSHDADGGSEELRQGFVSRDAILRYLYGREAPAMRNDPWCDPSRAISGGEKATPI